LAVNDVAFGHGMDSRLVAATERQFFHLALTEICRCLIPRLSISNPIDHRLGRTVFLTARTDWTAEQIAAGYSGQQQIEQVFRSLKGGERLGWGPMYHGTGRKISFALSIARWVSPC